MSSYNLFAFVLFPSSGFVFLTSLIILLYVSFLSSALNPWWKKVRILVNQ